jgi:AraC-like DNA-binding protein
MNAMARETFLASFGLIGLRLVELHGLDPGEFAREIGLPGTAIPHAGTRLPSSLLDRAFALAERRIADPAFALRAGECWHPSNLGTLGYAWLSSGSLRTGLKRVARHTRILGQRMASRCEDGPDGLRFVYDHGRGDTSVGHAMADFELSLLLALCRANYGADFRPAAVALRRPPPADPAPYARCFGCPIAFGAAEDCLTLAPEVADRPLPTSNRELAATFDLILARQLAELAEGDLESRCRAWLLDQLTSGDPAPEELARALLISPRTLQRRLGELGLSYRGLLESTRRELARRYLTDPEKSVAEITFLLGFSEQSAFARAFRRWHGVSPSEFRLRQRAAA